MSNSNCRNQERNRSQNYTIGAANFRAKFVSGTKSRFCTNFINGSDIDLLENCNAIHLEDNRVYLISYSYTIKTEEEGKLEITPELGGVEVCEGKTTVSNATEGRLTATNTFTVKTSICACLTFSYRACKEETGERPEGQISIVDLGCIKEQRRCQDRRDSRDCGRNRGRDCGRDSRDCGSNSGGCECRRNSKCGFESSSSSSSSSCSSSSKSSSSSFCSSGYGKWQ